MSNHSRRAILAGIAAAPAALAAPALALPPSAPDPANWNPKAALARLEQMIETLRTCAVCDGWHPNGLDEAAAARSLAYFRAGLPEESDHDFAERDAALEFISSHGQSLDWIICGDAGGMICRGAARSNRAALADAVLLDLVERYHAAEAEYHRVFDVMARMEDEMYAVKPPKPPRGLQTARRERDKANDRARKLEDQIIATPATTMQGVIAKARCVALNLTDGESASVDPDAEFAASMARDLLAMKAVS